MKTYFIIDVAGAKHGTVKAKSTSEAKTIFCGNGSQSFRDLVFAIEAKNVDSFISNLKNL